MPVDVAGIAGAGLQGFLHGQDSKRQTDLQREQFDYQKSQDAKAEQRAVELQNWAREKHGLDIKTGDADLALKLIELGNAKKADEQTAAMEGILKSKGLSVELISALGMIADMERKQESVKSEKMSQAASAASIEHSKAGTALTQLESKIKGKELAGYDINDAVKRLATVNSAGFTIDPSFAEKQAGYPKGTLTNTVVGGAANDPLSIAMKRADDALELYRKNPSSTQLKDSALAFANQYAGLVWRAAGNDPAKFTEITDLDPNKPMSIGDVKSFYDVSTQANAITGEKGPVPGMEQMRNDAVSQLQSMMPGQKATNAAQAAGPVYPPEVETRIDTLGIRAEVDAATQAAGRALTMDELSAIAEAKNAAVKQGKGVGAPPQESMLKHIPAAVGGTIWDALQGWVHN